MKFSVLMSVYCKENPDYFDQSLKSILIEQTVIPNELVLVKDGELNSELDNVVNRYVKLFPNIMKIIELKTNSGLGEALRIGLESCSFEYIARMDSDDISCSTRFEKQIDFINKNQDIDVVGSNIIEFIDAVDNVVAVRKVPSGMKDIIKMCKHRNPMNHVSVFFRKASVKKAGSYKSLYYVEDYFLWVRMILDGCRFMNINDELVYVRVGEKMYERRSDTKTLTSWKTLQSFMLKEKSINIFECLFNIISMSIFVYIPPKFKKSIYKNFFRKKVK